MEENIWRAFKDTQNFQVLGLDVWDGSISTVQNFVNGGNRNVTYPIGMKASATGSVYGLDRHSFVIIDTFGIIQYISPQSTPYTRRYITYETEMIGKITELLNNITSVKESSNQVPQIFKLYQNSPNPFRLATNIRIDILPDAENKTTTLTVYDILGRKIHTIYSGKLAPGSYQFNWHGVDYRGAKVPQGVYFYVLDSGIFRETKKLIYLSN